MTFRSRHLSPRQLRGLAKLGEVYAPGDGAMPSFSACGCIEHVDAALDYLPEGDRRDLQLLLGAISWCPQPLVRGFFGWLERAPQVRGPLGPALRFLRMGVKGLILTLYYSGRTGAGYIGPSSLDVLGYRVGVYTGDLPTVDELREGQSSTVS